MECSTRRDHDATRLSVVPYGALVWSISPAAGTLPQNFEVSDERPRITSQPS